MAGTEGTKDQQAVSPQAASHARRLLAWYGKNRRDLPWRALPGKGADAYGVWLSEIMLQQTTVGAVIPYYRHFTQRWPDIEALARAPLDEVLVAWQGLGYYARARNLVKCAGVLASEYGGVFPKSVETLVKLPGIGPYSAAAIAAIAFGRPEVVVDGNVERVIARLYAVAEPVPGAKAELRRLAAGLSPRRRPGDYAQAMMDLGATICIPRAPRCGSCPLRDGCRAHAEGAAAAYPRRAPRAKRPLRRGTAWFAVNEKGEILLRRRPEDGLLGGMMEVPSSPWRAGGRKAPILPKVAAPWRILERPVAHVFTHFRLELQVAWVRIKAGQARELAPDGVWAAPDALGGFALPSVMKKVCAAGLAAVAPSAVAPLAAAPSAAESGGSGGRVFRGGG
jgi:A/G-specific adenine glycosylase